MILTLVSRMLGIVKARVITSAFGASIVADVINTAFYLPNNFRKLFAEGAMNIAFIPSLSISKDKDTRSKLLSLMFNFQIIVFSVLIILFSVFARQIFSFISDFNEDGTILGAALLPYFIGFLSFISLSTIMASVLQYEKKFIIYGVAPLFFNLVVIFFVYIFNNSLGAMAMAYAVVLGSFVQLMFTLISVVKLKYQINFTLLFCDKEFKKVLNIWIQVIFSNIAILASQQYSAYLSTTLSTGSATAFANSMIFFSAPYGIIFTGIATVNFPYLSKYFSKGDEKNFKKSLSFASDGMIYLFIPVTIALMALSQESIAVVLQNGLFTFDDTILTSQILFHSFLGLTIIGTTGLMLRAAISRGLAHIVLKITIIQSIIDALLSFLMINSGVGIRALAIANNTASLIALILYFIVLKNNFDFKHFFSVLIKTMIINIPLILCVLIYSFMKNDWYIEGSNLKNFSIFTLIAIGFALVTLIMYSLNHIPVLNFISRKQDS